MHPLYWFTRIPGKTWRTRLIILHNSLFTEIINRISKEKKVDFVVDTQHLTIIQWERERQTDWQPVGSRNRADRFQSGKMFDKATHSPKWFPSCWEEVFKKLVYKMQPHVKESKGVFTKLVTGGSQWRLPQGTQDTCMETCIRVVLQGRWGNTPLNNMCPHFMMVVYPYWLPFCNCWCHGGWKKWGVKRGG